MSVKKLKEEGLIRLLAIWEIWVYRRMYAKAKEASKEPLNPKYMYRRYGQPISNAKTDSK